MRCTYGVVFLAACGSVTAAPDGGANGETTVTYTSQLTSGQPGNTGLVAFQDGDGPWQVAAGSAGVYTATIRSGRFGILAACLGGSDGSAFVNLGFYAVSDGAMRWGMDHCASAPPPRVTISGTMSGAASTDTVVISNGVVVATAKPANWMMDALAGDGTLIATRVDGTGRPIGMLLQHGHFAGGATFSLDFGQQFAPAEADVALDPNAGGITMQTSYFDDSGAEHPVDASQTAVSRYRVVPADRVGSGISVLTEIGTTSSTSRTTERAFKAPIAQTLALPPTLVLAAAPKVVASTPYPIRAVDIPRRSGAAFYAVTYSTFAAGTSQIWDVLYSGAWADAAGGTVLTSRLPDLSALPGWLPGFAPAADAAGLWQVAVDHRPARRMPGSAPYRGIGESTVAPLDGEEASRSDAFGAL